ncbi:MAG: DUF438 domain-containing protein [Myxococcales bacterium]|nr:DUF438 domain-containing protein [Myxococcales bacterium]
MKLSGDTKVHELLTTHPFLEDFLASRSPRFEMLRNRMARATIGRVATLRTAAGIAGIDLGELLRDLAAEIQRRTGQAPELEGDVEGGRTTREQRIEVLKQIVRHLHDGGDLAAARARFAEALGDVEASEIAAMEEELIRGGLPVAEVQRLCDVHVGTFRQALDEHPTLDAPPGHPIHTYLEDNRILTRLADELAAAARALGSGERTQESLTAAGRVLDALQGIENHYRRKENQLFPILERHGVTGPSQVMWGVHDQIRAALKRVRDAVERRDAETFAAGAAALARDIVEMIYKEEKILFPLALQTLTEAEWIEVRRGEDELGYELARPAADWPAGRAEGSGGGGTSRAGEGLRGLMTGEITLEQLNLILAHLPVDLSFVDEHDEVRFYSEGPNRIFPRSPAVIGRKVQNCHPPKSVHVVQRILEAFRAGQRDVAEFWIQLQGKFIHIRYFAVRDQAGAYRGCLEVSQDVTRIRKLSGEQRLLDWQP